MFSLGLILLAVCVIICTLGLLGYYGNGKANNRILAIWWVIFIIGLYLIYNK